ncbi:MAG: sugar phosphate isomerase/epimerase [Oscillospiraceae bacterium]
MKLGFITSILGDCSFEQMIDFASEHNFSCVEVACWPSGKAERRYAGVSHIDVGTLDDEKAAYINSYCKSKGVEISALAYYPNNLDRDLEKRSAANSHLIKVIDASAKLGVNMVTTFIGRDESLSTEENLSLVKDVFGSIVCYAQQKHVRIAIENCPMYFTKDEWPGGKNLFTTPALWRKIFDILGSDNLGINYDPSHMVWQMMDYVKPIYDFKDKIFHVHFKDLKIDSDKLNEVGTMAYPLEYSHPKIPGLGDINWGSFVSALTDIGYNGPACLEIEDRAFEGSDRDVQNSLILAKRYMEQFVI